MEVENVDNNQCGTIQRDYFEVVARLIYGTLMGTAIDIEDRLAFSVLENVRPMIETVPLAHAADAYARMMAGKARFRMVLVTGQ
jgi:D-arabinose 1-dehydrogenase-like Zn-dependent alcohol dehydrogenase